MASVTTVPALEGQERSLPERGTSYPLGCQRMEDHTGWSSCVCQAAKAHRRTTKPCGFGCSAYFQIGASFRDMAARETSSDCSTLRGGCTEPCSRPPRHFGLRRLKRHLSRHPQSDSSNPAMSMRMILIVNALKRIQKIFNRRMAGFHFSTPYIVRGRSSRRPPSVVLSTKEG